VPLASGPLCLRAVSIASSSPFASVAGQLVCLQNPATPHKIKNLLRLFVLKSDSALSCRLTFVFGVDMHVTAVIVTYGGRQHYCTRTLDRCLKEGADKVILVENEVTADASAIYAEKKRECNLIQILKLESNRGSAGGIGAAVDMLKAEPMDGMVLFLDDDNLLADGALRVLMDQYRSITAFDSSDPILFCNRAPEFPDDALALSFGEPKVLKLNSFMGFSLYHALIKRFGPSRESSSNPIALVDVDHGPWGGMFISVAQLSAAEPVRSDFYLYGDDLWFTYNRALQNVPMKLVGDAEIYDLASTYAGVFSYFSPDLPAFKAYYSIRNYAYMSKFVVTSKLAYNANKIVFLFYQFVRESYFSWRRFTDIFQRALLIRRALGDGGAENLGKVNEMLFDKNK